MEIQEYIKSGILEQYCLGLLNADEQAEIVRLSLIYPEIKQELNEIEKAIEKIALTNAVSPKIDLRSKILKSLGFADEDKRLDINNLPVTDKNSNHQSWLNAVEHLIPAEPFDDFLCTVLRQDTHIAQMLVITKVDVPPETHDDIAESFFILKGECVCTVGGHIYHLGPGDFLDIPLYQEHNVKMLSPYVIAILQHHLL
jgi:mannose-6-phosphate isomerase-like protein (cupin superfamily)